MSATQETDSPDSSSTPTSCEYDSSIGQYIKCNKDRFTATQLVGAGLGVTILIFAICFGLIWFCRRNRRLPQERARDLEEKRARKREEEVSVDEDEDEDDNDVKAVDEKRVSRARSDRCEVVPITKSSRPRATQAQKSGQTLGENLRPKISGSAPSSRGSSYSRSSYGGSPIDPQKPRQLYPSNPDKSPRSTIVDRLPHARPPSTWQGKSQPLPPQRQNSATPRPSISVVKAPHGQEPPSRSSSYAAQGQARRASHAPSTGSRKNSGVIQPVPRAASAYVPSGRQPSYNDLPLPPLPVDAQSQVRSRSGSAMSTSIHTPRPPSRAAVPDAASRRSHYPDDPPDYTSSSSRETSPKVRPSVLKTVSSYSGQPIRSRSATVETVDSEFVDALDEILEVEKPGDKAKTKRGPKKVEDNLTPVPYV